MTENESPIDTPTGGQSSKRQFLKQVLWGAGAAYLFAPVYAVWRYLRSPSERRMPISPMPLQAQFLEGRLKETGYDFVRFGDKNVLIRQEKNGRLCAFNLRCTHAGCTVEWQAKKEKFVCPCHGAEFDRDGAVAKLPAILPLEQLTIRLEGNTVRLVDEVYSTASEH